MNKDVVRIRILLVYGWVSEENKSKINDQIPMKFISAAFAFSLLIKLLNPSNF